MPKVSNAPTVTQDQDYQVMLKVLNELKAFWVAQLKESKIDEVKFSRLALVALTQWASIVAVDIGMSAEQFTNVCKANFIASYEKAPKFG